MQTTLRQFAGGIFGALLISASFYSSATSVDITASFSPSMQNPANNSFTNTTSQSGYCASYPTVCTANGVFSVGIGVTATLNSAGFKANSQPREGMYFKMPGAWRSATVTNAEGETSTVEFRVSAFSAKYNMHNGWVLADHQGAWNGSSFVNAPAPCGYSGVGAYSDWFYRFMWKWPVSDVACYKTASKDLTGDPYLIDDISIAYELKTPDPLKIGSGDYTGTLHLTAGPGGDIDFGDNFTASDSAVDIRFHLSVNHELKLTTTAENQTVSLQPCQPGRVCTADEGKANWERWMVSRITPQLTGRSNFNLSSSGAFTVYLDCAQQAGADCALKSSSTGQLVPVQSLLTLPDNIVDSSTGSAVRQKRLAIGKDVTSNVFSTRTYGQDRQGSIDFLVKQRDVDTMLSTRPDSYSGTVTVIFDPNLY